MFQKQFDTVFYLSYSLTMKRAKLPVNRIASVTGLSPATVSRVINHPEIVNDETKKKVEKAIRDEGYDLDALTKRQTESNKRIIVVALPSIDNPFYNSVVKGIKTSAHNHSYEVLIYTGNITPSTVRQFFDVLKMSSARGVISISRKLDTEIADRIDGELPFVQCCEYNCESVATYVSINDYASAKTATEYILNMNYRRIALINGPLSFNYAVERQRGFESALSERGIIIPANWKISVPEVSYSLGYSAASQLLGSKERPDAIFCAADVFAISVIKAAKRYSLRVPEDLGVVGFDNIEVVSVINPGITTINQPSYQIGFTAGETLFEKIVDPHSRPRSILLDTELIARDSIVPYVNRS